MENLIETKMEDLLNAWKNEHLSNGRTRFIYDGCADYEQYAKSPVKILFLLREGYFEERDVTDPARKDNDWVKYFKEDKGGWIYRFDQNLKYEKPWYMWCKVETILEAVYAAITECPIERPLQLAAFVNLKKSKSAKRIESGEEPDNKNPYSNSNDILACAVADREKLLEEISILSPDMIICGGTYETAKKAVLLGESKECLPIMKTRGLRAAWKHQIQLGGQEKDVLIIDMWHPSARISPQKIGDAIGKIAQKRGTNSK